jgi:hypothetical protein
MDGGGGTGTLPTAVSVLSGTRQAFRQDINQGKRTDIGDPFSGILFQSIPDDD